MPAYPGAEAERRVAGEALLALVHGIFQRCGLEAADAALLADSPVQADLRGVHSHGACCACRSTWRN